AEAGDWHETELPESVQSRNARGVHHRPRDVCSGWTIASGFCDDLQPPDAAGGDTGAPGWCGKRGRGSAVAERLAAVWPVHLVLERQLSGHLERGGLGGLSRHHRRGRTEGDQE